MRRHFLTVLIAVNLAMLFSWLRWIDAACLLLFFLPPFLMARHHWGSGELASTRAVLGTVLLQITLFLVLRRYPGFDVTGLLGHPVAVIGVSYIMSRQIHLIVDAPYSTEPSLARALLRLYDRGLEPVGRADPALSRLRRRPRQDRSAR